MGTALQKNNCISFSILKNSLFLWTDIKLKALFLKPIISVCEYQFGEKNKGETSFFTAILLIVESLGLDIESYDSPLVLIYQKEA